MCQCFMLLAQMQVVLIESGQHVTAETLTFYPNYLLLNFGKLFSGRYGLRDLQVAEYHIVEHFQSCQMHNPENG